MQAITAIARRYLFMWGSLLVVVSIMAIPIMLPAHAAEVGALSSVEIQQQLAELPDWTIEDRKLHREFEFDSFIETFGWMSSVAIAAEALGHHPEWCNVYNRVSVDLTTHDVGGISNLDFELAKRMDDLAS